jgi:hypothetical protein
MTIGMAAGALLATLNLGCATKRPPAPQITDTWTAAAERASAAAGQAEAAAGRAETAAIRVEAAAKRAEDASARIEAMVGKTMIK